ncbi:flavin reductase domain protein (plasmid) [Azospirillum sp. B510]|uniref:flavin reductase n=1 Tax=Azospirillum sp. (strain B510) TaxID=137722 RepID=UPI0001C4B8BE|nr:flavin reductase [Azospirillum sp. B510]BAI74647.1 flavin reductase domain protein [Azospirillum sp. B510]
MNTSPAVIDPKQFRSALGAFATGVTIVTTHAADGTPVGLTANSFNSVSLDPPMVLWSLAKTSASLPAFMDCGHFAVHVLTASQKPLSDRFARRGEDKFSDLAVTQGLGDTPLLEGCSARFQCRTAYRYEGGDHIIFVGEVLAFDHSDEQPLLFHGGRYARMFPQPPREATSTVEVESSFRKDFLGYLAALVMLQLYAPVRRRCGEKGIGNGEYYVMSLLAARHEASVGEIDSLMTVSDERLSDDLLRTMLQADLITMAGTGPAAILQLTQSGRALAIELFAIAKAAEEDAAEALDPDDMRLLKTLLKRIVRRELAKHPSEEAPPETAVV